MSAITLDVNGTTHRLDVDPTTPLLYVLSEDLQLRGPKFGCGLSQCGACTAIVNGDAVRTCVTPVSRVNGATISTLDGLGTAENPHPIQKAFIDEQAAQCGFCESRLSLSGALAAHEKAIVEDALRASDGRVFAPAGAAARLGIPRSTLEARIRTLKINKAVSVQKRRKDPDVGVVQLFAIWSDSSHILPVPTRTQIQGFRLNR